MLMAECVVLVQCLMNSIFFIFFFKNEYYITLVPSYSINVAFCFQDIKHVCAYLYDLKKASAEEMRKSVLANYSAFIR